MTLGRKAKRFDTLDQAMAYGVEVDYIAVKTAVPTGKLGTFKSMFVDNYSEEISGKYYYIEQDFAASDAYYVRYNLVRPRNASHADILEADRQITKYLNQKYKEISPREGISPL